MAHDRTAKEVFEAWGNDYHADGMESEHWPRVRRIFNGIEPSDGRYLEIGVGNGYGVAHMATHQFAKGECFGMDLSASMVERARERAKRLGNVSLEAGDFLAKDFGGRRFNTIFSMEVFYYFPDIGAGIDKAYSLLEPGGKLWVAVNFYEENEDSDDWPDRLGTPMQRWSKRQYAEAFERAGFADVSQQMVHTPLPGSVHGEAPTLVTVGTRA